MKCDQSVWNYILTEIVCFDPKENTREEQNTVITVSFLDIDKVFDSNADIK